MSKEMQLICFLGMCILWLSYWTICQVGFILDELIEIKKFAKSQIDLNSVMNDSLQDVERNVFPAGK